MTTTIQIQDETLELLKKVKKENHASSYDEAIRKIVILQVKEKSMGGYLGSRPSKQLMKGLRDKHDRL